MKQTNTIIIGMKHVGKTTFAQKLAQENGGTYISTDDRLVAQYNQTHEPNVHSAREVHKAIGEVAFRTLEEVVVQEMHDAGLTNTIIDTGGGIVLSAVNRNLLPEIGRVIYLHGSSDIIIERILKNGAPSYIQENEDPKEALVRIYNERDPLYRKIADVVKEV